MQLVVTIDTEEDNWLPFNPNGYTTNNARRIPGLQKILSDLGVRPTYLVTWQMVMDPASSGILRDIHQSGGCEIGTHCHPWSQPPYEEKPEIANSMLCNLPPDLQSRKIRQLHDAIQDRLQLVPTSFRSGRWGYGPAVAETLHALGYKVDSSITAHTDWRYCLGPDFSEISSAPFRFDAPDIRVARSSGRLLEVPASVGYLQSSSRLSHAVFEGVRRSPLRRLRLLGLLNKLRLLNRVSLTPEQHTARQMITLVERMQSQGFPFAVMWFHSSTLMPGLTPYVRNEADAARFIGRIREFLDGLHDRGIAAIPLCETAKMFPPGTDGKAGGKVDGLGKVARKMGEEADDGS